MMRARTALPVRRDPHDITHMDGRVLGFFARHPGSTQIDLGQHSGRGKAQLARLVRGLHDQGLLQGEPDASDRRNLRLTITPAGVLQTRAAATGPSARRFTTCL